MYCAGALSTSITLDTTHYQKIESNSEKFIIPLYHMQTISNLLFKEKDKEPQLMNELHNNAANVEVLSLVFQLSDV